jgi:amyloid beta precursor protein binding protein 1
MADRVTPPPLQGPSAKEKKYDRQLRLWGANGQQALEEAHVLLLNSGAGVVGIETLKNLILPGVGHFTIVDGKKVEEEDLGVNFFLEESSLGKSRAEEYCKFLRGLNPEVEGHGIQKDVEEFLRKEDWEEYNLILVVAPVDVKKVLVKVREVASKKSIPVFYIHSVGFYSQFSIQLAASFPVVETHPDQEATEDLRLLKPWPELEAYFEKWSKGLRDDSLTAQEYGHVPYLALLHYYIGKWSKDNGGRKIETYKEKNELKVLIRNGAQKHNPGSGEENHEEAEAAVLKTLGVPSVPSGLKEILVDDECSKPRQDVRKRPL